MSELVHQCQSYVCIAAQLELQLCLPISEGGVRSSYLRCCHILKSRVEMLIVLILVVSRDTFINIVSSS